jgi:hypothetical protein
MAHTLPEKLKMDRKAFSVGSLNEPSDEKAYWLARSPAERLQQMEILRRIDDGHRAIVRLQRVLKITERKEGRYLLIGGYAVGYHGYPRATNDMDVWIASHPDNARR